VGDEWLLLVESRVYNYIMIVRELKLKLTKKQEIEFEEYLWKLTGLYNWVIRTIDLYAKDKIYFSYYDIQNSTADHAKRIGVHSQVFQQTIKQAYNAWERCFKKLAKKPKLKSIRNKLKSFTFPQFQNKNLTEKKIKLPSLGEIRFNKQEIPPGKIKLVKIVKKASGWYAQLTIDAKHVFEVKETIAAVGIDTGFKHLAILSEGTKIDNPRNYVTGQKRLGQAQRGHGKKLTARLHERISNRRKDHNHKISRKIVENFKYIAITKDNLRNQSKIFGKSVSDAGIAQLRTFKTYKGDNHGRVVKLVDSRNTTMTCGNCGELTGPRGLSKLAIRVWECPACGAVLDRDVNAANVILKFGFGTNLEQCCKQQIGIPSL
jgi:putative transposase